jgi:hypothetical protein
MAHTSPEPNAPPDVDVDLAAPRSAQLFVSPDALAMLLTVGVEAVVKLSNKILATSNRPIPVTVLMFTPMFVVPADLTDVMV